MSKTKWLEPFYSCQGSDYCASEQSYPANMLREYEGKIWCQVCWEDAPVIWLDDEQEDLLHWSDLSPFVPEHEKRIAELEAERDEVLDSWRIQTEALNETMAELDSYKK